MMKPYFVCHVALLLAVLLERPHLPMANEVAKKLTRGMNLQPPDYITCPSGEFAFGFRALESDPSRFLLAIWFNLDLPPEQQKVVWYAKGAASSAVTATAQSVFSITLGGDLSLATTGSNIWPYSIPSKMYGYVLVLQDSGNLQFLAEGGTVVWESFQHPTDTLLAGQSMVRTGGLVSKLSDTDFSPGRFNLRVQADGNIVWYIVNPAVDIDVINPNSQYWATMTNQPGNTQDGNTSLFFEAPGYVYYQTKNDTAKRPLVPPLSNESTISYDHQHAVLDPDGVLRVYAMEKTERSNVSWAVTGWFPKVGCRLTDNNKQGLCGPNSYCVSGPDRLHCDCPSGYSFIDAQRRYRGCTPDFLPQSCDGSRLEEFEVDKLQNTSWTNKPYEELYTSEQACGGFCLRDCLCTAALFDGQSQSCRKMAVLAGLGLQESNITDKMLIKVRRTSSSSSSSPSPEIRKRKKKLPFVLLGCSAFLLLLGALASLMLHLHRTNKGTNIDFIRIFSEKELHKATNGFSKLLGRGGFGEVYHGVVTSLHHPAEIAVKKLITSNEYSEREFANEVQSIGKIHHRNLVRMVGYCKERQQRMLVFEFMPGGSLRTFLFQPQRPQWRWRADAALGIAKGLEYLHEGCNSLIIHCDIKLDNILLDGNNNPKITDFGIAKLLSHQQVITTVTNVRGTRGYIAPEWFKSDSRIDNKVDVYSFGVVLLEMICCRKCQEPITDQDGEDSLTLFGWAGKLIYDGRIADMLHSDDAMEEDMPQVTRFSRVALWCIEQNPSLRPTMHQVVQMLEGVIEVDALPDPSSTDSFPLISPVDGITSQSLNNSSDKTKLTTGERLYAYDQEAGAMLTANCQGRRRSL